MHLKLFVKENYYIKSLIGKENNVFFCQKEIARSQKQCFIYLETCIILMFQNFRPSMSDSMRLAGCVCEYLKNI